MTKHKRHSVRPQDKPQTKLRVQQRRAKLMKIFAKGATVSKAQKELAQQGIVVSRATVGFDLQALGRDSTANVEQERQSAHVELRSLQKFVADADDMNSKETVDSLLAIRDRINRLLGLDAPQKSVVANVGGNLTPAYIEIAKAMADVEVQDRPKVLTFIKSLAKPIELTADCFPPAEGE